MTPSAPLLPTLLLAAALGSLALFLHRGTAWPFGGAWWRAHRFARIAARTFVHFAAVALLALAALGRLEALVRFPGAFAAPRAWLMTLTGGVPSRDFLTWSLAGVAIGGVAAALLERRGRRWTVGDIGSVQPSTRGELAWGVLLSIEAGVAEEWFFRLAIPLLVALVAGSAGIGFALGIALFGLAHRYQGWAGMLATALVGVVLTAIYLLTASLWVAIAIHVAIDLNALVLRPVVSGRVRLFRAAGSR